MAIFPLDLRVLHFILSRRDGCLSKLRALEEATNRLGSWRPQFFVPCSNRNVT
ncbi:hypothetical protein B0T16DRAFT_420940 [Cercophora newfieldiana]|uniref:Uncharacterized protein n=1 Tax=Cercophora newfieldiana TaxID=92897 RepID=A0AA39XXF7_9PEZI|nr:hypothetical protein B0T16DRAFT_420940 [Cercophora newfieldiana]